MLKYTPYEAINGLLGVDIALIGADHEYAVFSVRVPRAVLARNALVLGTMSDLAAGFDIAPAPPERRDGGKLLKVPFGYIGANEMFAVLSMRIAKKDLAENHAFLTIVAALADGFTPEEPNSDD